MMHLSVMSDVLDAQHKNTQIQEELFEQSIGSMNTSENNSFINRDMTDYDNYTYYDNYTCDTSQQLPDLSIVFRVLYYMLFCLGLPGNTMVIWLLLRYIRLKSMTDVCLLNLALSDLILALSLPLWAQNFQNLASCKLITGVYQLGFYSGTLFVTLMSADRYLAIVHAVAAMRARTLCYGIAASITIWVISTIMAIPEVIYASLEMDESSNRFQCQPLYPPKNQQAWKMRRNFSENIVSLFICLPIMIFCYVKILVVLSSARNSKKGKAVKLIFIIVCVFVVCWVPYNVVVFLKTLDHLGILNDCVTSSTIDFAMGFAEIIALAHCCVNPVIYALVGEKFRKSLRQMLLRHFYKSRAPYSYRETTETSNTPVRSDY